MKSRKTFPDDEQPTFPGTMPCGGGACRTSEVAWRETDRLRLFLSKLDGGGAYDISSDSEMAQSAVETIYVSSRFKANTNAVVHAKWYHSIAAPNAVACAKPPIDAKQPLCFRCFRCLYLCRGLNSILTLTPNPRPILIKDIRHRHKHHRNACQDRYRVVNTEVLIERHSNNRHTASSHISNQRDRCQSTSREALVTVNDVLVASDEDTQNAVTKEYASCERRPDADVRVCRPGHPEEGDGNGKSDHHLPLGSS